MDTPFSENNGDSIVPEPLDKGPSDQNGITTHTKVDSPEESYQNGNNVHGL